MLGHKISLGKFKKIEIISNIFSDPNSMRLEINLKRKKPLKNTNTKRLNNVLLNNHWITEETQEGVERREPLWLPQAGGRGVEMDS